MYLITLTINKVQTKLIKLNFVLKLDFFYYTKNEIYRYLL